ncbi:MAG: DUF2029 domain-containing protein [Elusimicrobiaceae bacterium]|nr:DUF2029 domain-containing protein [Elusimicrobiaceae bacterium]
MNKTLSYKNTFWIIVIASFFMWFAALVHQPNGEQSSLFFLKMHDFWADATNVTGMSHANQPYLDGTVGLENAIYPPLAYVLFHVLSRLAPTPQGGYLSYYFTPLWTWTFVLTLCLTCMLLYTLIVKNISSRLNLQTVLLGLAFFLSKPMLTTLERGNMVLLSALFVMVFIFYYDSKIRWQKETALISLALAAGLKITPALFGILLLYRKDWYGALRACLYGLLFFFMPFLFLKGGFSNLAPFIHNLYLHMDWFKTHPAIGTTLFSFFLKFRYCLPHTWQANMDILRISTFIFSYVVCAGLLAGTFHLKAKWQKVLNVSLAVLILPAVSQSYCLLYLFPAMVLFLKEADRTPSRLSILILVSWLFTCFVYVCPVSLLFDHTIAVPLLLGTACVYTWQANRKLTDKEHA